MPRVRHPHRPWWFLDDELAHLFGYAHRESARQAMTAGTFPVPARKIRNLWCVDKAVVKRYFDEIRFEDDLLFDEFTKDQRSK